MNAGSGTANFVVHCLAHLRAALAAGEAHGRAILALSAPDAAAFAGPTWFLAMIAAGRAEFSTTAFTAVLDCSDGAGDVLTALEAGASHVIFTGHPQAAVRLRDIAARNGAEILNHRPPALDLIDAKDADFIARAWCRRLPEAEPFGYSGPMHTNPGSQP